MNKEGYPLILMGMHRSGTSLLARLLERCGLFLGEKKDSHSEAFFFLRLNEWLLAQAHCSWDNVDRFYIIDDFFLERVTGVIDRHLKGIRRLGFLGLGNYLRCKDIREIDFPWGWKDPRNTVTLQVWKEIFPRARILHVYRNPVDVARSLRQREVDTRNRLLARRKNPFKALYSRTRLKVKEFSLSGAGWYPYMSATPSLYTRRVIHLMEGYRLWEQYVSRAFNAAQKYAGEFFSVRYEDFLENPTEALDEILDFIGLEVEPAAKPGMIKEVSPARRFAFLGDDELTAFYRGIRNDHWVEKTGYADIL